MTEDKSPIPQSILRMWADQPLGVDAAEVQQHLMNRHSRQRRLVRVGGALSVLAIVLAGSAALNRQEDPRQNLQAGPGVLDVGSSPSSSQAVEATCGYDAEGPLTPSSPVELEGNIPESEWLQNEATQEELRALRIALDGDPVFQQIVPDHGHQQLLVLTDPSTELMDTSIAAIDGLESVPVLVVEACRSSAELSGLMDQLLAAAEGMDRGADVSMFIDWSRSEIVLLGDSTTAAEVASAAGVTDGYRIVTDPTDL